MTGPEVTTKGVLEIAEHEGVVLGPYYDSKKIPTYGVGHTRAAGGPDPNKMGWVDTRGWPEAKVKAELVKALALFDDDLDKYEDRVRRAIKVKLKPHQFDALVSFDFNTGGIVVAKLTEAINRGDMGGDGFMGWIKPKELMKRRQAEQALFRTGDYEANGDLIPVYDALPDGRTRFRRHMRGAELLALMPKRGAVAAIEAVAARHPPANPVAPPSAPAPGRADVFPPLADYAPAPPAPAGGALAAFFVGLAAVLKARFGGGK